MKGRKIKGIGSLNPLKVTSAKGEGLATRREGATTMNTHLFVPLWQEAAISNQSTDQLYLADRIIFATTCYVQTALGIPA